MEETKICCRCKKEKPLSEFYSDRRHKDGLRSECKQCSYSSRKGDKSRWYAKNRDLAALYYIQSRDRILRQTYGITLSDYDEMLEKQGGLCAICGKTSEEDGRRLSVDHDHETNEVRGLLCSRCNKGLGIFQDDPVLLHIAASYLEYFK